MENGKNKHMFMGGISFIAIGELWQLPPIGEYMITEKNNLDGRPHMAPSHWQENFKLYYLTEKMRSQDDLEFSNLCDRISDNDGSEFKKFKM